MARIERLIRWPLKEGPVAGLALFRIVVGLMALRYLVGFGRDWSRGGFFGDYFFLPYTTLIPQPNEAAYLAVLVLGAISAAALIVGSFTRAAAISTLLFVAYHFSLNQIWHRHNRYFLVLSLFLLCLGPSGRALSFDALRLKLPPVGPLWSAFLIKAQMTLIYLASAISKTLEPAWRSGDVLDGRALQMMWARWMPEFVLNVIPPEAGVRMITAQALASEYFLAIFLWFRRTRRFAIWWGILFHGYIEMQYSVITFSYLTLGTYFNFADLKCGEKRWVYSPQNRFARFVARCIPYLDWVFQMRLATYGGHVHRFVDRDGRAYEGVMSWIMLGANLPILYPICYPLSWLRFMRLGRCRLATESTPVESPRSSRYWIVAWAVLYLFFIAPVNIDAGWDEPAEALRFWDLPWFFALMCFVAGAYHWALMRGTRASSPMDPKPEPARATR